MTSYKFLKDILFILYGNDLLFVIPSQRNSVTGSIPLVNQSFLKSLVLSPKFVFKEVYIIISLSQY
jgi:hypothetical protein